MKKKILTIAPLAIAFGCNANDNLNLPKPVDDWQVCRDRVEAKLFEMEFELRSAENNGPEFYVLDGSLGGDLDVASAFMRKNGWVSWASTKPGEEKKLFLIPNEELNPPPSRENIPLGEIDAGPRLACRASQISKVPFVLVQRRTKDLSRVVYEFQP